MDKLNSMSICRCLLCFQRCVHRIIESCRHPQSWWIDSTIRSGGVFGGFCGSQLQSKRDGSLPLRSKRGAVWITKKRCCGVYNKIDSHNQVHCPMIYVKNKPENITTFWGSMQSFSSFLSKSPLSGGTCRDIIGSTNALIRPEWSQCDTGSVAGDIDDVLQRQ